MRPAWNAKNVGKSAVIARHILKGDSMNEDCSDCPDLKCEYSANLIWYCKHDPRHARSNEMLRPGGKGCKKS